MYVLVCEQHELYVVSAGVSYQWPLIETSQLSILYIIVSLCNLPHSYSDDFPNSCSILVGIELFLCLFSTYMADFLCTFLSWCIPFWMWGSHTIGQRVYILHKGGGGRLEPCTCCMLMFSVEVIQHWRKPSIWLALTVILLMWVLICISCWNVTPRYLISLTLSSVWSFSL